MSEAQQEPSEQALLTPAEAAKRLHVSPVTIRHWALQGRLPYTTTPGGHRRFRVEDIDSLVSQPAGHSARPNRAKRILVVDDDRQVAGFLQDYFTASSPNAETFVAHDGFDAAVKLQEHQPDLVMLDLMMPGLDGESVCKRIKQNPLLLHARVIGMTGYPTPENIQRMRAAGAETCLAKPLDPAVLRDLAQQMNSADAAEDI